MQDNWLPVVSDLLHHIYREQRRAYLEAAGFPWPQRRSRKRKPFPGLYEVADDEAG